MTPLVPPEYDRMKKSTCCSGPLQYFCCLRGVKPSSDGKTNEGTGPLIGHYNVCYFPIAIIFLRMSNFLNNTEPLPERPISFIDLRSARTAYIDRGSGFPV